MKLARYEPFRELEEAFRQLTPLLRGLRSGSDDQQKEWAPTANISETETEYLIKAELPEVRKEDIHISLADGVITIRGERKKENTERDENEIRVESFYGSFCRRFALPDNIDPDHVKAEAKDGVLRVSIPKKEQQESKGRSISVQ
jgi:HSP20 family protein